ncbi:hypothetical protein ACH4ZU_01220 [Streptomyces sp. NPDC020472]|uniref:hypothetical protein n=1 Tax=Streptomyces sp. NPDC020472 TaxID=3365075 RepID=UPI003798823F
MDRPATPPAPWHDRSLADGSDRPEKGLPRGTGAPATRALGAAGYTRLAQLAGMPAAEPAPLRGVGPKALRVLGEELAEQGLSPGRGPPGCTAGGPSN